MDSEQKNKLHSLCIKPNFITEAGNINIFVSQLDTNK